ncbi:hypothetical protein CVT26_007073 [Gymnopilus dilepis]|uniref:U3 small nucleolar ribonucleoprotein protein IMP4 n=1 Tax=Gymnopilus dilepis TaxID=231916 RepID=A0A409VNN1_9AGAR|nr:hypothetical protein CVT26_007073 [Gymnopilus dilepis]
MSCARWNRFVLYGESDPDAMETQETTSTPRKSNAKSNKSAFTSLANSIHESEIMFQADGKPSHRFEVILEPSSYTPEKFALYKKYQSEIHNDKRNNPSGFKRFLKLTGYQTETIPYSSSPPEHLPLNYGSYHQLYMLDGDLIAMGVIDILPKCVSSVYFMYDKTWERFSMGKLSALREVSLANEMREAGAPNMGYLYMGFYIYSCQKMRYKGDYAPSYLADPETYEWFPLEKCIPLLEEFKYACFANIDHSSNHDAEEADPPSPKLVPADSECFDDVKVLYRRDDGDIGVKSIKLRRQIRERRQYVYAKSLEAQERQTWERKQKLKESLASGKALPTELKKSAKELGKDLGFDEAQAEPTTHIDNEYSRAGVQDPKIVITTSRDPSSKLLQFAKVNESASKYLVPDLKPSKEMRLVFPNSHRINRGNYVVKELAEACRANDVTDLIVVHEHRGVPDALIVSHFPHGPTVYFTLNNVALRHDIGSYKNSTVSEQYPHLIFENFSTKLGERIRDVLKYLFPVPKEDAKRVMTFANEDDFISFRPRHHVFVKAGRDVQLAEVGPRFEMKPYEIRQGTIEQNEAEREWVLSHYTRTAKKRSVLSNSRFSEPPAKRTKR